MSAFSARVGFRHTYWKHKITAFYNRADHFRLQYDLTFDFLLFTTDHTVGLIMFIAYTLFFSSLRKTPLEVCLIQLLRDFCSFYNCNVIFTLRFKLKTFEPIISRVSLKRRYRNTKDLRSSVFLRRWVILMLNAPSYRQRQQWGLQ